MPKPLTRKILDTEGCLDPTCNHPDEQAEIVMSSVCHIGAGMQVVYQRSSGCMIMQCVACGRPVAEVLVAKEDDDNNVSEAN